MRTAVMLWFCLAAPTLAQPLTPAFTYQGELSAAGVPAAEAVDLRFRVYSAPSGGVQVGPALSASGITPIGGRFAVSLDFGASAFTGASRWLEVDVSPAGQGAFTTLAPRQELAAAPGATFAVRSGASDNAAAFNGQPPAFYTNAANLTGALADARLSTNVPRLNAPSTYTATVTAPSFVGALTGNATTATSATNLNGQPASFYLNAANLTGVLADARLSGNVALRNAANSFTQTQAITTPITTVDGLEITHRTDLNAVDAAGVRVGMSFNGTARVYAGFFDAGGAVSGVGVFAQADAASGPARGVWGRAPSLAGHAGYFEGRGYFSGDVGVGTESPEARLHVLDGSAGSVSGSANSSAVFERSGNNYLQVFSPDASERGIAFGSPANSFVGGMYYTNAGGLNFRAGGNSTRMVVSPAGDVGIGISPPAARLDVAGDIRASAGVAAPLYANLNGEAVTPVAVASFDASGAAIGASTGGVLVSPTGTGSWNVTFSGYSNANVYSAIITTRGAVPTVGTQVSQSANGIAIRTFNLSGTATAVGFNIAVYRMN